MGAKKTPKSIEWLSRAAGEIKEITNNFDIAAGIRINKKTSSHKHKSSEKYEIFFI